MIDFRKTEKISALGGRGKGMRLKGARGDGGAGVVAGQHGGGGTRNREGTLMRLELSAHRETPQESHVLEGSRGHVLNGSKTLSVKVFGLILWACRILS